MYFRCDDGVVKLPTHYIYCTIPEDKARNYVSYQIESDRIVCYSLAEKDALVVKLNADGVPHTDKALTWDAALVTALTTFRYGTRSAAIEYLTRAGYNLTPTETPV